jgi:hypothetical protein
MPSQSVLLPDDKSRIKASIPKNNKILTATVVRIFYQKANEWVYSGVQGGLCLVDLLVSPLLDHIGLEELRFREENG